MTGKQTPPKTEAEVQVRKCCSCDKPDSETALLTIILIILPPVILEKQNLCPPCLAVTIDNSKKGMMIQ